MKINIGDKMHIYKMQDSEVNNYLSCRDGIVEMYEYKEESGYGSETRLFLCENTKTDSKLIIRHTYNDFHKNWIEESMHFDSDSFVFLDALINGKKEALGGKYTLVRDY